jgi:hypothetical protein
MFRSLVTGARGVARAFAAQFRGRREAIERQAMRD